MKKFICLFVVLLHSIFFVSVLGQQYTSVPYFMGFEDTDNVEWSKWVVNPGSAAVECHDQWMRGTDIFRDGRYAVYISSDSVHSCFDTIPCVQYLYRDFTFDNGTYELSFDWLLMGNDVTTFGVGINSPSIALEANSKNGVPDNTVNYTPLSSNSTIWNNYSAEFTAYPGQTVRIFFIWASKNTKKSKDKISVCIDNIQICKNNLKKPHDFVVSAENTCNSVLCTWKGLQPLYELQYRKTNEYNWRKISNIEPVNMFVDSVMTRIFNMEEGLYDFRIRGIATGTIGNDTSSWLYATNQLIFCPQEHCINYADLTNSSFVTCTYGNTADGAVGDPTYSKDGQKAYTDTAVLDYGSTLRISRHTTNWDKSATDSRTGGSLKLIPDNAYVSVRLGNWDSGNGAESVTYDYYIDSAHSLLLLQYAIVMEDPVHPIEEQPRFILEILRGDGKTRADDICGYYNFAANKTDKSWKVHNTSGNTIDTLWKDWTMVGLNLKDYIGEKMKIRLTTYDCFQSGHFCYAYYTIDCTSAILETATCGLEENPKLELIAPEGFKYAWYSENDPVTVLDTNRKFFPSDTMLYRCVVTSKQNKNCFFELSAKCMPQIPNPRFTWQYAPQNCENNVEFINKSFISVFRKANEEAITDKPCKKYQWETWSDSVDFMQTSTVPEPFFTYPMEGGKFHVRLTASLEQDACSQSKDTVIYVPPIENYYQHKDTTLCQGSYLYWEEKDTVIQTSGTYVRRIKTFAGCDSTVEMNVSFRSTQIKKLPDTVILCPGDDLCIDGDCYDKINRPSSFIRNLIASNGCDSTVIQDVFVIDSIKPQFQINDINSKIGKYTADITIAGTGFDFFEMNGVKYQDQRYLTDLAIGHYSFIFYKDTLGRLCQDTFSIDINGQCLILELAPQIICNQGQPTITFPYTIKEGNIPNYSVIFSSEAHDQGFVDIENEELPAGEINISIPESANQGMYDATIVFHDTVCEDIVLHLSLIVAYPATVLFHRWDDVISIKGPDYVSFPDFIFTNYQWYLNEEVIPNATMSYYWQPDGLLMDGEYYLKMIRIDSVQCYTCPYVPGQYISNSKNVNSKYHNLSRAIATEKTKITIYNLTGQMVNQYYVNEGEPLIKSYQNPGMFIISVENSTEQQHYQFLYK